MSITEYSFNSKTKKKYTVSLVYYKNLSSYTEKELNNFFSIYDEVFKDSPTEDKEELKSRLKVNSNPLTLIGVCKDSKDNITGGYVLELYKETSSILLTYLFVVKEYRDKKIGSGLIDSIERFYDNALKIELVKDKKIIYFETKSTNKYSQFSRYGHVGEFFTKKGGLWLDIQYIEPLSKSDQYFLGAIPIVRNNLRENLLKSDIKIFLNDFYLLTAPALIKDQQVESLFSSLEKEEKVTDILKEFPKIIIPKLKFKRASVCFHVIQDDRNLVVNIDDDNRYCKVFNSFEKDLFSQNYIGDNTPYFSKHIDIREFEIKFKNTFSFNSEGREETFIIINDFDQPLKIESLQKKAKVYLNHTYFKISKIIVWEIVIHPIDYFNEYELIQLEKYFTGKQEGVDPDLEFFFKQELIENLNLLIVKLIEDIPSVEKIDEKKPIKLLDVQAGTIQVDTAYLEYNGEVIEHKRPKKPSRDDKWYWSDVYQYYNSEDKKDDHGEDKLENYYEREDSSLKYILNTFCGIALGIFDFDRMSFEEVIDTLVPRTTTDSYFLILNKSAITCFCHENKIYEAALKQGIGINPYLIIPNTLLSYNSYWTSEAEKNIEEYEEKMRKKLKTRKTDKNVKNIDDLGRIRDILREKLKYPLPNVYQYETERDLYDYGMDKRGTNEKKIELENKKKNAEEDINIIANKRAESFSVLAIILSIISLTQIYQLSERLYEIFDSFLSEKGYSLFFSKEQVTVSVVVLFLFIFIWLIYYFKSTAYYVNKYEV